MFSLRQRAHAVVNGDLEKPGWCNRLSVVICLANRWFACRACWDVSNLLLFSPAAKQPDCLTPLDTCFPSSVLRVSLTTFFCDILLFLACSKWKYWPGGITLASFCSALMTRLKRSDADWHGSRQHRWNYLCQVLQFQKKRKKIWPKCPVFSFLYSGCYGLVLSPSVNQFSFPPLSPHLCRINHIHHNSPAPFKPQLQLPAFSQHLYIARSVT